jgi:sugar phosphate isomerase/epimerase
VEILRQMSDEARDAGADLLLYPHAGMWLETIGDAVRVADKIGRPNVNVMFNLCHWMRADKQRDYKPLLRQAMPRLHAVSICGADVTKKDPVWTADYILTLDAGTFDVGGFLKTLKELGYRGPIGLQCYGIGGDERVTLTRSMAAWQRLKKNLED